MVGKSRLPWAVYHGERSGVKLHVSYSLETEMPVDVVKTTGLRQNLCSASAWLDPTSRAILPAGLEQNSHALRNGTALFFSQIYNKYDAFNNAPFLTMS